MPAALHAINDCIHDATSDVDALAFDDAARTLGVPMAQEVNQFPDISSSAVRPHKYVQVNLRIYAVRSFSIGPEKALEDPWMLNVIRYDEPKRQISLDPVVGPTLVADVDRLHLEAHVTDHFPARTEGRDKVLVFAGPLVERR